MEGLWKWLWKWLGKGLWKWLGKGLWRGCGRDELALVAQLGLLVDAADVRLFELSLLVVPVNGRRTGGERSAVNDKVGRRGQR